MNTPATSSADRRRLAREARDAFPPMGVYAVRNRATGSLRIASSRNVHATIHRMQFELRLRKHPDKLLQSEWDQDPAAIAFEVLELVKQRTEAGFDYAAELRDLEEIHRSVADCPGP